MIERKSNKIRHFKPFLPTTNELNNSILLSQKFKL